MAKLPIYTLSNISGETGIYYQLDASKINSISGVVSEFDSDNISCLNIDCQDVDTNNVSTTSLSLNYDLLPSSDPAIKGVVWRDSNNFLKISSG